MVTMRGIVGIAGIGLLFIPFGICYGQEDYTTWAQHQVITLNTTSSGANVPDNEYNFPVLIRLNSANFSGFSQAQLQGADIRFSKSDYSQHLSFQIERWVDKAGFADSAEIWVRVDTVLGNNASQSIVMHYGMTGVTSPSNGPAVFDTTNGYQAVYHFNEGTNGNANDATINNYTATATGAPTDTIGIIGRARYFNGSTMGFYAANTESPPSKVCFPSQGVYTLSAWVLSNWTTGNQTTPAIISKGTAGASQYQLYERGTAGTTSSYEYSFLEQRASGGAQSKRTPAGGIATSTAGQWVHIVGVRNGPTTPMVLYINGVNAGTGSDSAISGGTRDTTEDIGIGARLTTGSSPTDTNRWHGLIDEPEIASVARDSSWVKLSFQNQQANQTLVTLVPAPASPVLSSPTNSAINQPLTVTLAWGAVATATSYAVQVSTVPAFVTTVFGQSGSSATSQVVSGLLTGTTYYWRANATGSATGTWSAVWSFATTGPLSVPVLGLPTNGAINQSTSLMFSWGGVAGAQSYTLQVATVSGFTNTVFSQSGITAPSQAVGGLANLTTYYWRANAFDGLTQTSGWSGAWTFTTIVAVPGTPALSSPTNAASNQPVNLSLSWGAVSTASSYQVQLSTDAGFGTTVFLQAGLTTTSASASGLANSTTYYWRAGATNAGGSSAWSGVWSFTTIVAIAGTPVLSSPASGAAGVPTALTLTWGAASGATSYAFQISTASTFATTLQSQGISVTSASVSNLALNATYYWRVAGINGAGQGSWSSVWSFTTTATGVAAANERAVLKTDFTVRGDALYYSIASSGGVEITFSDLLGRAALVVKRLQPAGRYSLSLRECALASGRYIVRFKAAGFEKETAVLFAR